LIARVGRVPLYLLDSDMPENNEGDRNITARLYGGGRRCRLKEEIVLGIGGLRALERLGTRPTIRHINEGHAAFASLEKLRQLVAEDGLSFDEAREMAAAGNIFTTHRCLPAGAALEVSERLRRHPRHHVRLVLRARAGDVQAVGRALLDGGPCDATVGAQERGLAPPCPRLEAPLARRHAGPAALRGADRADHQRRYIRPPGPRRRSRRFPFSTDVEAARRELDSKALTIGFARRVLAVGLVRRFLPACQTIRAILRQGILGDVQSFHFAEGGTFRWPTHSTTYFQRSTAAGGVLADIGTHLLDLITWWMGEPSEIRYEDDAMGVGGPHGLAIGRAMLPSSELDADGLAR
jgi:hypothetical protein